MSDLSAEAFGEGGSDMRGARGKPGDLSPVVHPAMGRVPVKSKSGARGLLKAFTARLRPAPRSWSSIAPARLGQAVRAHWVSSGDGRAIRAVQRSGVAVAAPCRPWSCGSIRRPTVGAMRRARVSRTWVKSRFSRHRRLAKKPSHHVE